MARRHVTATRKDKDGDIAHLCNPFAYWSPRPKIHAIGDVDSEEHMYFLTVGTDEVDIHVVQGPTGPYLRTDPDKTSKNNLDDLPGC